MEHRCARPGCDQLASATLRYDYAGRTAWIDELVDAPGPVGHHLCARHADGLTVPHGWRRHDRRGRGRAEGLGARASLAS